MEQSAAEANAAHDPKDAATEDLAYVTGVQAYVYGFATVELYRTFNEQTQTADRAHSVRIDVFIHIRRLATPDDAWVVSPSDDIIPNAEWAPFEVEFLFDRGQNFSTLKVEVSLYLHRLNQKKQV